MFLLFRFNIVLCNKLSITQPEHAAKVSGVLLEMSSDVLKLLNSPNSLAIKDKPIQVLKEANTRTGTDAITFSNPKSARCLSY